MTGEYMDFISRVKQKLGIDLMLYKEAQMKRRLTSLRNKRGFASFNQYFQALDKDDSLLREFVDRITINVSEFYRNPKRWEILRTEIVPQLTCKKRKLSVWSAACSTGEEPYSFMLMAREHFPGIDVQVLATDIDETVLAKARQGSFPEQALHHLPDKMKKKYFTEENGCFCPTPRKGLIQNVPTFIFPF